MTTSLKNPIRFFAVFIFGVFLAYLVWVAVTIKVNYYDSYEILVNAKLILSKEGAQYSWTRPPFLPLAYAAFFALEQSFSWIGFGHTAAHLFAVVMFAAYLWAAYRFFCLFIEKTWSLIAVGLLACNPLLIHSAPFCKEDIPAAVFITSVYYLYDRYVHNGYSFKYLAWASFFACLTFLIRYNAGLALCTTVIMYEICRRDRVLFFGRLVKPCVYIAVIPGMVLFLILSAIYKHFELASFLGAPKFIIQDFYGLWLSVSGKEPPIENYYFLLTAMGWPLCLLAVLGIIVCVRNKARGSLLIMLWFGILFYLHTYVIGHKEARYLIPVFVPLYFFAVYGMKWILTGSRLTLSALARQIIIIFVFTGPVIGGFKECLKFQDPFYRTAFAQKVSRKADQLADGKRVRWVGKVYPTRPDDYIFHIDDEYGYVYHFNRSAVHFYVNQDSPSLSGGRYVFPENSYEGVFVRGVLNYIEPGGTLIVNYMSESYNAKNMPEDLEPLVLEKVQTAVFSSKEESTPGQIVFTSSRWPKTYLNLRKNLKGIQITLSGVPDGTYELYMQVKGQKEMPAIYPFKVENNTFEKQFSGHLPENALKDIEAFHLLYYDPVFYVTAP